MKEKSKRMITFTVIYTLLSSLRLENDVLALKTRSNCKKDINLVEYTSNEIEEEDKGYFHFIKESTSEGIFSDHMFLLYGGISLIAVSIIGILLTLIPRKNKVKRKKYKKKK